MQSTAQKKVIYSDSGKDIAIVGTIIAEDDFFILVKNSLGREYRIGKKAVVCIKEAAP